MMNPMEDHWKAVKMILRYIVGTILYGLTFSSSNHLNRMVFCDADLANDLVTEDPCLFFVYFLVIISFPRVRKKQTVVVRSTTEAEYRSLANVVMEILWVQSLLKELKVILVSKPLLLCDNMSTILLSKNPLFHNCNKHLKLDLHFVKEKVTYGLLTVAHVPSIHQVADILTKPLSYPRFSCLRSKLRVSAGT